MDKYDTLEYSRVKATMISMCLRIYLCAFKNTNTHDNEKDQVTSSSSQSNEQASASNNIPILQPTNITRDHPLDTIIGDISRGV